MNIYGQQWTANQEWPCGLRRRFEPSSTGMRFNPDTGNAMAENPSNFVRDWISANVQTDPDQGGDIEARVAEIAERLTAASREAEIPQDDPELAPDLLRDLIHAAIQPPTHPNHGRSE